MPCATTDPACRRTKRARIFEAYYTTKEKGTGLGLAIVKHNVELYGGTVRLESKSGQGAEFTSILPRQSADEIVQDMSVPLPPVLVVDDEKNMRLSLQTVLKDEGYAARAVESAEEALDLLAREEFFMVITDARLGGMSGYDFLARSRSQWPDLPVLMITAYATPKLAVEAIKAGAIDYVGQAVCARGIAPCRGPVRRTPPAPARKRRAAHARRGNGHARPDRRRIAGDAGTAEIDPDRRANRGARFDSRRERHRQGTRRRRAAPFEPRGSAANYIRINCAAIPETLLESELFGHEKGAFTGAFKQKSGRVEEADGGTIFLDEIADMSKPLQAKLLRFLEDGTFTRVGGTQELRVNVRLIAATNRDLAQAIAGGQFREDLFHRLNVVQIQLPPLRDRGDDVLLLADHFLKMFRTAMNKSVDGLAPAARQKIAAAPLARQRARIAQRHRARADFGNRA